MKMKTKNGCVKKDLCIIVTWAFQSLISSSTARPSATARSACARCQQKANEVDTIITIEEQRTKRYG